MILNFDNYYRMMIMKKNVFCKGVAAIYASVMLFGCSQGLTGELIPETLIHQEIIKELSQNRTYEEALAIAQDAIALLGENCTTRSGKQRVVNTNDGIEVHTSRIHLIYNEKEFSASGLSIQVKGNISAYHSIWHYGEEDRTLLKPHTLENRQEYPRQLQNSRHRCCTSVPVLLRAISFHQNVILTLSLFLLYHPNIFS